MTVEGDGTAASAGARPWIIAVGGLAVVVLLGLAVAGGGALVQEREAVSPAAGAAQPVEEVAREAPAPERPAATSTRASTSARVIEDTKEAALPRGRDSGWVREAPRAPLGPSQIVPLNPEVVPAAAPPPPAPGEPRPTLLFQPVATAAGRIEAAGHVVEIEGVEVLDPAQQCDGDDGGTWPCGTVARAAFRAWLRGRAVECTVAPTPGDKPVVSPCRLGKEDAAAWLVANGFAAAEPGGPYEEAGAKARAARRGIFGDRPKRVSVTVGAGGGILPDLLQQTTGPERPPPTLLPPAEAPAPAPDPAQVFPAVPPAPMPLPPPASPPQAPPPAP